MVESRSESTTIVTASERATGQLGLSFGLRIESGLCVSLVGSLGTGKSVLVRGICKGLGVDEDVLSPTFVLFEEYRGRIPVVHLDLYRLEHEREIEELGVFDRVGDGSVVLVEWGDRSPRLLDISNVIVSFEMAGETQRRIVVEYPKRLAALFEGA
jgi:tRNA threonylcarbamoyladenosine biosynthesis protein TsaE